MKKIGIVEVAFGVTDKGKEGLWLKLNEPIPFEWEKIGDRYFLDLSAREEKTFSFDEARKKHPQAYAPWTQEDDNRLELLYCEGMKVKELSKEFGRNKGAIQSRIKKLELKEKYG